MHASNNILPYHQVAPLRSESSSFKGTENMAEGVDLSEEVQGNADALRLCVKYNVWTPIPQRQRCRSPEKARPAQVKTEHKSQKSIGATTGTLTLRFNPR